MKDHLRHGVHVNYYKLITNADCACMDYGALMASSCCVPKSTVNLQLRMMPREVWEPLTHIAPHC